MFASDLVASTQPCEDVYDSEHVLMQTFSSSFWCFHQQDARSVSHNCNMHIGAKEINFLDYFVVYVWFPCLTGLSRGISPVTKQCLLSPAP